MEQSIRVVAMNERADRESPGRVRGYELMKDRHLADAEGKQRELLEAFRLRARTS